MGNILDNGESFLKRQMERYCSEEIEYRASDASHARILKATVGRTLFKVDDITGVTIRVQSTDFFVAVNDLCREPQKGDIIIRRGKQFEVYAPNDEPCWRFSGDDMETYRIHTHYMDKNIYHPLEVE